MAICVYCGVSNGSVTARKRQLCPDCFISYVNAKVLKRMERYRLRHAPKDRQRKLLLALSCGVSSLVLLHILDQQLNRQLLSSQGRAAYDLHVLLVDISKGDPSSQGAANRFDAVRAAYPRHTYTEIPSHSLSHYGHDIGNVILEHAEFQLGDRPEMTDHIWLDSVRSSFSTATSRSDIDGILLTRVIVGFAKEQGCEGVLWGDSDSRLAAKALANVAKGRGFSLPWQICDGMTPWDIHFSFPLRDLFKTELELYSTLVSPGPLDIITPHQPGFANLSNRNMSIDDLITQYVAIQGEKYPGVMANIVRTIDKLQVPSSDLSVKCAMCGLVVNSRQEGISKSEVGQGYPLQSTEVENGFKPRPTCYGCSRSFLDIKKPNLTTI